MQRLLLWCFIVSCFVGSSQNKSSSTYLDLNYFKGTIPLHNTDILDYSTKVQWGCYGIDLPNVLNVPYNGGNPSGSGAEIGDGVSNTNNILIDCSDAPAALAARSVGAQWFLPSAKELNEMYDNRTTLEAISVFTEFSPVYWSSTEFTSNLAWGQNFFSGDGNHSVYTKEATCNVRAVRAF